MEKKKKDIVPNLTKEKNEGNRNVSAISKWKKSSPNLVAFPPKPPRKRGIPKKYPVFAKGEEIAIRRPAVEEKLLSELEGIQYKKRTGEFLIKKNQLLRFLTETLPEFRRQKYILQAHKDLLNLMVKPQSASFQIGVGSGEDWFGGQLVIPEVPAEEQTAVFNAWKERKSFYRTTNGSWVLLDALGVEKIQQSLESLGLKLTKAGEISKIPYGSYLALQTELEDQLQTDARSQKIVQSFRTVKVPPLPRPKFQAKLRGYQLEGVEFIKYLYEIGTGGVLADDMGLGKTVQMLCFIQGLQDRKKPGRVLVVAPVSAISVWRQEAEKFCPEVSVISWHGNERAGKKLPGHGMVLTSYGVLVRDLEILSSSRFDLVVLDEAQNIKNIRSQAARAIRKIPARSFFALTLDHWYDRLVKNEEKIRSEYGELFLRMFKLYLRASAAGFRYGGILLYQLLIQKGYPHRPKLTRHHFLGLENPKEKELAGAK